MEYQSRSRLRREFKKFACLLITQIFIGCNLSNCEINSVKTIFTTVGFHQGDKPEYGHYILLEGIDRNCLDSTKILDISHKYIDTLTSNTPATVLMFYNSEKNFIPNSTSQVQKDINKNCLVKIIFEDDGKTPVSFMFYDKRGHLKYNGNNWGLDKGSD